MTRVNGKRRATTHLVYMTSEVFSWHFTKVNSELYSFHRVSFLHNLYENLFS